MTQATVIIAAWKAEKTLATSVESALAQGDIVREVIVADDASPDGTSALAQDLAARDARVKLTRLTRNAGPAAARNAALDLAQGDWIAVLDADDAMRPNRLTRMIAYAEAHWADIVCDDLELVGGGTRPGRVFLGPHAPIAPQRLSLEDYLAGNQARPDRPSLGFLKPALRRAFLETHRLRYDETLRNGEDFHLVLAALTAGAALWLIPEAGYLYTTRTGSLSNRLDPDHARALAEADAAYLDRMRATLSREAQRLMRQRTARLSDLAAAEAALRALKARHLATALATMTHRPRAAGRLLRQLLEAAKNRTGAVSR
ncbi:MAG: glycosyltransferase family 2 protein [Pseudomonadota bacterium]